jgi:hypothetical protein
MSRARIFKVARLGLGFALLLILVVGGKTLAQVLMPPSDPVVESGPVLPPSYDSADPSFQAIDARPPDDNPPVSLQSPTSPSATFSYYQVAGATLTGRSSSTQYAYDSVGCSHLTAGTGSNLILNTELHLPDGAVIKYLRVYYKDTNPSSGVKGYITRYQPGVATKDMAQVGSSDPFASGYGYVVSAEITETVNNSLYAYTLLGWPDVANSANQICGLRVAYYPPLFGQVFMPLLNR